ncbi:WD-repeat-containing protein [Schizopora paradoxa]|uniref:WD-repeat-containing protein n=1 Tax=Schizopora paradoxa TaxID=27342 RepID=A0A0H2R9L1_9AGAM|nr:WD-repeat-containing protein [Schizopora paradoxa]
MVKSYSRHGPTEAFGLVCSSSSNSAWDGKFAYVPALEDVIVWDVKRAQMMGMWHETGHRAEVTCIERSPKGNAFAVGYADGSVRLWDPHTKIVIATFNGHKKAVTALAFDREGVRFASGSQDTDLIVWDVVGEAGLFRLRGHRDQITAIRFVSTPSDQASSSTSVASVDFLLTSSKDTLMKLWDLSTQHCVQTVVAHSSEVWSLDLNPSQDLIFTGSSDGDLKVWKLDHASLREGLKEDAIGELSKMITFAVSLPLSTKHRITEIAFHPTEPYLAVQSHDKNIDILRVRTEEEIRKKIARRKRREREKSKAKASKGKAVEKQVEDDGMDQMEVDGEEHEVNLVDRFTPYLVIRASGKVRSFSFSETESSTKGGVHILAALATNSVEVYNIPAPSKTKDSAQEPTRLYALDRPGHRTDIRTLCVSSDDQLVASASNGSLKIWNLKTTACIRTIDCPYAICSTFLPGDRQIAVGTKSGEILLFDFASSSLVETIKAHSSTVWSLHVRHDGEALVSGSGDKDIKFWEFERESTSASYIQGAIKSLVHVRTLKMSDDVLAVRYSPNGKLLAVSLLDSTVKIFYQDTLKFFLSLYGHKLPVLSLDISDDSKLIVTCSADKNIKIWGLDFGDCHKSIFAHEDSIMQVAFEKDSHNFWSVGKDRLLKYWDGDKFVMIQKLEGHHGEIWALAVSHRGNFVVTGSQDKSIRVWEKLDDQLFIEEEREIELERMYENGVVETLNRRDEQIGSGAVDAENTGLTLTPAAEATSVSKQTADTLTAGEKIIEALELADAERAALAEYEEAKSKLPASEAAKLPPPPPNAMLAALGMEPEEYVLDTIEKVSNTALLDALLVLPFGNVLSMMVYLDEWVRAGKSVVLISRILVFLMKTHYKQIVAHRSLRTSLIPLRKHLRETLVKQKEVVTYNLAALRYLKRNEDAKRTATLLEEGITDEDLIKQMREKASIGEPKKRKRIAIQA